MHIVSQFYSIDISFVCRKFALATVHKKEKKKIFVWLSKNLFHSRQLLILFVFNAKFAHQKTLGYFAIHSVERQSSSGQFGYGIRNCVIWEFVSIISSIIRYVNLSKFYRFTKCFCAWFCQFCRQVCHFAQRRSFPFASTLIGLASSIRRHQYAIAAYLCEFYIIERTNIWRIFTSLYQKSWTPALRRPMHIMHVCHYLFNNLVFHVSQFITFCVYIL